MPTWPSLLPRPQITGYGLNPVDQTVRTDMEVGSARSRRRTTSRNDQITVNWLFTDAQMAVFRAFFDGYADGGSAWFSVDLAFGDAGLRNREARFIGPWQATPTGGLNWDVTAKLETRGGELTADQLKGAVMGLVSLSGVYPTLALDFAGDKALDSRITFTRASEARYYDGKTVAKAEENLLLRSQEFNLWSKTSTLVTENFANAPDGTATADLVYPSSTGANRLIYRGDVNALIGTTAQKVFSVYAKASGKSWISFTDGSGARYAHFNVSTGTVGGVAANHTASIVDVGGGWYRCVLNNSVAWGSPSAFCFGITDADNTSTCTANGTDGVLLWGAQVEQRSTVTAYTPTTDQPITNYIPVLQTAAANVARFDHNPVTGESLGLLIEEQRTNLLLRSAEFDNVYWPKTNTTITSNAGIAPDGTQTADIFAAATDSAAYYYRGITVSDNTAYTYSLYVKQFGANTAFTFYFNSSGGGAQAAVTSTNGVIAIGAVTSSSVFTGAVASATPVGNGWYRLAITATTATGVTFPAVALSQSVGGRDGYSGLYIWGAQLEAGAFPTSYIPTVASQVTRNADAASMTGVNFSSWYRADEGSMSIDFTPIGISAMDRTAYAIWDNGAHYFVNSHTLRHNSGYLMPATHVSSSAQFSSTLAVIAAKQRLKVATAYAVNNFSSSLNGGNTLNDTLGTLPVVDRLLFPGGGCNYISKFAYYPARLPNADLQALTA